jgi:hypothetical protein
MVEAVMGYGGAFTVSPTAVEVIFEPTNTTILPAPRESRHTTSLVYASVSSPMVAQIEFLAQALDMRGAFRASLRAVIALTPVLPGGQPGLPGDRM